MNAKQTFKQVKIALSENNQAKADAIGIAYVTNNGKIQSTEDCLLYKNKSYTTRNRLLREEGARYTNGHIFDSNNR